MSYMLQMPHFIFQVRPGYDERRQSGLQYALPLSFRVRRLGDD